MIRFLLKWGFILFAVVIAWGVIKGTFWQAYWWMFP